MNRKPISTILQRAGLALSVALTPILLTASSLIVQQDDAEASSHREAPLISKDQYADNTDVYAFVSPQNPNNIVLIASWIPFEGPEGGPNYFEWDDNAFYDIHVDNNGDAVPDFTYTLQSKTEVRDNSTFLYSVGQIGADGANWNRQQRYTVTETSDSGSIRLVENVLAPPVNIGGKSTPNYEEFDDNFIYHVSNDDDDIKLFAGQTDDAFWVDLQIFDLVTLRGEAPPIGYDTENGQGNNIPVDSVAGFNNHSLVIEMPIDRLVANDDPVLGVWATSRRPSMRVLLGLEGLGDQENSGDPKQVSRLGMPLTNEVVLPYALKDAFNALKPEQDLAIYTDPTFGPILQKSVEDPELGNLLCGLYGVPLPGDDDADCKTELEIGTPRTGRGDIFDIFLTGMVLADEFMIHTKNGPVLLEPGFNVNRPANVVPADMLRVNTAIKGDLCAPTPSRLGVLGGDACGFPNGRRLIDDVVEIEILAVAGAAYGVLDGRDDDFEFNAGLIDVLTDNVDFNDKFFQEDFPYMATAQSGQEHFHQNAVEADAVVRSVISMAEDDRDDAEERPSGKVNVGSRDLELGSNGGTPQTVGIRFQDLHIPQGATILTAHIEFTAEEGDENDPTNLTFYGEATGDAEQFSKDKFDITDRNRTEASVMWSDVPAWDKNERYWTPDLSDIVQEIIEQGNWEEGNALAFIITGDGERSAWSVDGKPGDAPMFYAEYSMGGTTVSASALLESSDVINRNTVSSTILRGTNRGNEILEDDDATETIEEEVSGQETEALFLPYTTN